MEISGKVALITGSAKRIGRATAVELAKRGARIAVHFRSSAEEARETLRLIEQAGSSGALFQADLTDPQAIMKMFLNLDREFGRLDILVNSASIFNSGSADETTSSEWNDELDSNARAPFLVAQSAARMMMRGGEGSHAGKIVNIVDAAGKIIWPGYFAYSVSKAALIAVNRGLAKAYAPSIQVNGVAPGPVLFPDRYTEEQKQAAIERTLLKRAGNPNDVVNAIVFLIENDYITGEIIHVDGGRHIM
jgi:NAD(P)-dependent dehydrogenase (short-subunit alcohol dehydrogenase family)